MGQKVNPVGFRLGTSRDHDSIWFAKSKDYSKLVLQDLKIRKRVKEILPQAPISSVVIKRTMEEIIVDIKTSRPGIVIGKKGEEIEKIKSELKKLVKQDVKLNVVEIKQPDLDAQLVADSVTQQLEKRIMFRKAMKRAVQNTMRQGAKGIRIEVSGRLNGAEIARSEWYREGRVPLHTLKADIDYATSEALTTYGILGVKVWIYRGDANAPA
ncbi:MAG: 30S ribosomal protein S3 [Gammaproteobacteria bacterium]|tara:strand:+ start:1396 stop:2031 length:636 start_codon:yes stop_codon:yes gene_type:complete